LLLVKNGNNQREGALMATWYIGADVDSKMTELAMFNGREVRRHRVPTTIPALKEVLTAIGGHKRLTFEEGPMAQWLYRNLKDDVTELIVCDPRRNRLITDDGDKADPIDAGKLAELLRGRHLRAVYHSDNDQQVRLKEWVSLYHDRVRESVRQINKIRARCRMHGLRAPRGALHNGAVWQQWLGQLAGHPVAGQLRLLSVGLAANRRQVRMARRMLGLLGRRYPVVAAWQELPGIGLIRAVTLLAYLDTPWRFAGPKKLWKYCGVGLQRKASGSDNRGRAKPGTLKLAYRVNRRLKEAVVGAAWSAIGQGDNVFADYHGRLLGKGIYAANAWHAVARKMLTVMWGMWKNAGAFDETCVCGR
jgi:transposase